MADLEVDLAALRRGGQDLRATAQRLRQDWAAFSGRVQSMGDIFGDDAVGGLIGASYQAAHQIADGSFASVPNNAVGPAHGTAASWGTGGPAQ